jgi:glycosyltransferase involved in cell wall biosynthesis
VRLAIVATHPIQYHAPWYRALAGSPDLDVRVLFAAQPDAAAQGVGFGQPFSWDVPLLEGYPWQALNNRRRRPALGRFFGSDAPSLRALRQLRPDAVLVTGWQQWPLVQAVLACRRLRIPAIVRGESNNLRRRPRWAAPLHRAWLRQFAAVLAIGSLNREFYRQAGVPGEKIVDCPYFVDNDRFAADAERLTPSRAALRRRWNIADGAVAFAFVGKLQPKKRPVDLIEAAAAAYRRGAALHLLIVGTGELEADVRDAARATGVPTTFTGFLNQSEIASAYVASDAIVLPSDADETWGLVVNEAMACGRPAIVSDRVGCGPDLIVDGHTGYRFPFGDRAALSAQLERLCGNRAELAEMGAHARRHVAASFSVAHAVAAVRTALTLVARR